jgi:hypothetical protein
MEEKEDVGKKRKSKLVSLKACKQVYEAERYFFKYAFPCAQAKVQLGSLRKEEYEELKENFLEGGCPDKETLERYFQAAFRRIKKLADKLGKDIWDMDVLKEYWTKNHNEVIDEGEGMYGSASQSFKELCKIHEAEVIQKDKDNLIVAYDGKERVVSGFLVPDAKQGDKVRIHFAYAVEKVN